MDIVIVKYNAGNLYSVVNAFRRLGVEPVITDDASRIAQADKVIFLDKVVRRQPWLIFGPTVSTRSYAV